MQQVIGSASYLILVHAGVRATLLLSTAPPLVWEVLRRSSGTAGPEADVPSEDARDASLSFPPSALTWPWLRAPELETSSEMLSSVDMLTGP